MKSQQPFNRVVSQLSLFAGITLAAASSSAAPDASKPATSSTAPRPAIAQPFLHRTNLFESGVDGYARYRIPGIAITSRGTVLVTCDARKDPSLGDWSDIDLFLRRSVDLGRTWEPPVKMAHRGLHPGLKITANPAAAEQNLGAKDQYPFNNQTLVIDRKTGDILYVYCINYERCFQRRSRDEGATWSAPEEISAPFESLRQVYNFKVLATGPNRGIQLRTGRLLIPVWLSRGGGDHGHRPSVVSSIYSDDGGKSWKAGEIAASEVDPLVNPSETIAVEVAGGAVMFSIRHESFQHRRGITYSPDGATEWTRPEFVNDLAEPICMAGIDRLTWASSTDRSRLVYSHCDNGVEANPNRSPRSSFVRKNLTIRLSYDEGRTWPVSRVMEPGFAGYSDITVAPDGTMFCFYENGAVESAGRANQNRYLTLAHFNLEWLTEGRDALPVKAAP